MTRCPAAKLGPALALTLAAACDGDVVTQTGAHLDYAHAPALTPCAGTLAHMDGYIPFAAAQLGLDAADFARLSYAWLEDLEYQRLAPERTGGHAWGRRARALTPIHLHELAHLVVHERVAAPRLGLLNEGLAVALEDLERGGPRFHLAADPLPFVDDNRVDDGFEHYAVGGGLVALLLGRWGPERLFALHQRLHGGSSAADFEAAVAEVYGRPLAELLAEGDAPCPEGQPAIPLPYACAAPTIPWDADDRWSYRRTLDCAGDADVRGGLGGGVNLAEVAVTVDVATAGRHVFALRGDPGLRAILGACAACPWLLSDSEVTVDAAIAVDLAAGRHAIKILGPADEVALASVSLTRLE